MLSYCLMGTELQFGKASGGTHNASPPAAACLTEGVLWSPRGAALTWGDIAPRQRWTDCAGLQLTPGQAHPAQPARALPLPTRTPSYETWAAP